MANTHTQTIIPHTRIRASMDTATESTVGENLLLKKRQRIQRVIERVQQRNLVRESGYMEEELVGRVGLEEGLTPRKAAEYVGQLIAAGRFVRKADGLWAVAGEPP